MSVSGGPNLSEEGLVLYLDAANVKSYRGSGTAWNDLTNNSYNALLYNGPTFDGGNGGSIVFDGTNDMAQIPDMSALYWAPGGGIGYSTITIDMWVKSSDTGGRFYTKPWNGSGQYNIWIYPDNFYLFAGATSSIMGFARNLSNNTWTNIVCWANATQMGYYINGNQHLGSQTHGITGAAPSFGATNIPTGLMTLYPYDDGWGGDAAFSIAGNLASCKFYNKVLSPQEVLQNFNATRSRFGV
jgi:hypothetical protein